MFKQTISKTLIAIIFIALPLSIFAKERYFRDWLDECEKSVRYDHSRPEIPNERKSFLDSELDTLKKLFHSENVVLTREDKDYSNAFETALLSHIKKAELRQLHLKADINFLDSIVAKGKKIKNEEEKRRITSLLGKKADSEYKIIKAFSEEYKTPNDELNSNKIGPATLQALNEVGKTKETELSKLSRLCHIYNMELKELNHNEDIHARIKRLNKHLSSDERLNERNGSVVRTYEVSIKNLNLQPQIIFYHDTVTNPYFIDYLYTNFPDELINLLTDNIFSGCEWILEECKDPWRNNGEWEIKQSYDDEWQDFFEHYPFEVRYFKHPKHPEYRIVGDGTYICSIWDNNGKFITALPSKKVLYDFDAINYFIDDVYSYKGLAHVLAKDAYLKNLYNIQNADPKVSRYVRLILGLEELTPAEKANIKKLENQMNSAFAKGIRSSGTQQDKTVWDFLKAQQELDNQPWKSDAGKRWFEQLADTCKVIPYDLVKEDVNTYFIYYKNINDEIVCAKKITYVAQEPYSIKEEIEYIYLN